MLFKLSNLNSNLALTLSYLNPALNNSAQKSFIQGLTSRNLNYVKKSFILKAYV